MPSILDILQNGDYYLDINGKSKHLGTDEKFNEFNYGAGLTAEYGNNLATMGYYKNSLNNDSFYAGYGMKKRFGYDPYLDIGILAGGVTGYEDTITPLMLPLATIGLRNVGQLNMMYAPEYNDSPATFMMNLGIPF